MKIYTKAGELAFKTFTFPDGQPHFKLETYDREFDAVTVETALKTPGDLFLVGLVASVLRASGYTSIQLDIRYLLGARMDRAIGVGEPFTLAVVAQSLNSCGFSRIRILDAHSDVATRLIRNSDNILPLSIVEQVKNVSRGAIVVVPDKGAVPRVAALTKHIKSLRYIYCTKTRDEATGALSGFKADLPFAQGTVFDALILDDICDGGGTFVGLAEKLRELGARSIYLFVTHGIFSKGVPLKGIDHIYTTDSYTDPHAYENLVKGLTIIPISMKDLK